MTQRAHRLYTISLEANEELPLQVPGRQVACLSATGNFEIKLGDEGGFSGFAAGLKRTLAAADNDFHAVRIRDTSGAPNAIELFIGYGDIEDSRLNLSAPIDVAGAGSVPSTADVSLAATSATVIKAATTDRRRLHVTNLDTSVTIRVGDASVTATRGRPVGPGETVALETSAAVSGYNPSAGAVSVAVLEEVN